MFNIFEGLDKMGLNIDKGTEIYEKPVSARPHSTPIGSAPEAKKGLKTIKPEDILYYREYECPVCDNKFKNATVKLRKSKYLRSDTDLKMYYEPLDPMYYDIVLCPHCGYAALTAAFGKLTTAQAERIKNRVSTQFKAVSYPMILTAEMAIERYKLALLNAVVKLAKDGEKAFLCLKLTWLYRDTKNEVAEQSMIEKTLKGFTTAFQKETFPIWGIEEFTLMYIIADLYRRSGDTANCLRYLGRILSDRSANPRIKDRAMDLKILVNNQKAAAAPPKNTQKGRKK